MSIRSSSFHSSNERQAPAAASGESAAFAESSSGRSPLNQYFHTVGERQREVMEKVFHAAIDGSCLRSCGSTERLEDQMDLLMHCRQPLSFFPFFEDSKYDVVEADPDSIAYAAPRSCEYCGAARISDCPSTCQRPKLYLRSKRPPFSSQKGWDPVTEYKLPEPEEETAATTEDSSDKGNDGRRRSNWVSGLFGVSPMSN